MKFWYNNIKKLENKKLWMLMFTYIYYMCVGWNSKQLLFTLYLNFFRFLFTLLLFKTSINAEVAKNPTGY